MKTIMACVPTRCYYGEYAISVDTSWVHRQGKKVREYEEMDGHIVDFGLLTGIKVLKFSGSVRV